MTEELAQGSPEWFQARKGLITGSIAGAILGISPFMTRDDVMRSMVRDYFGEEREFTGNIATEYGSANEFTAVCDFEAAPGFTVTDTGFHKKDWLGASPDGLISEDAVLEVKCPFGIRNDENPTFKTIDDVPHYYAQMQLEMYCTDRTKTYFWQWSKHGSAIDEVELNQDWLDENLPKLNQFYQAYLATIENEKECQQYLEPLEVDMNSNETWKEKEAEYLYALGELEARKQDVDSLKAELLELADNKKCVSDSLTVFKTVKKGSISYAKAIKSIAPDADLEPYRGNESSYWTVKVK